jgi:hypothetical protein
MKVKDIAIETGLIDESQGDSFSVIAQEGYAEAELLTAMKFMLESGQFERRAHFDHFIICMAESVWSDVNDEQVKNDLPF